MWDIVSLNGEMLREADTFSFFALGCARCQDIVEQHLRLVGQADVWTLPGNLLLLGGEVGQGDIRLLCPAKWNESSSITVWDESVTPFFSFLVGDVDEFVQALFGERCGHSGSSGQRGSNSRNSFQEIGSESQGCWYGLFDEWGDKGPACTSHDGPERLAGDHAFDGLAQIVEETSSLHHAVRFDYHPSTMMAVASDSTALEWNGSATDHFSQLKFILLCWPFFKSPVSFSTCP